MADKFLPNADGPFKHKVEMIAYAIGKDPARFMLSLEDAQSIRRAVDEFVAAFMKATNVATRTKLTLNQKDEARAKAERVIRKYANVIRANPNIDWAVKSQLHIYERTKSTRQNDCPQRPPTLRFVRSIEANGMAPGRHVLEFQDGLARLIGVTVIPPQKRTTGKCAKPPGAARVELYVGLFSQDEQIPACPEHFDGRTSYLRSFTKNPIEAEFPIPAEPRWVVYWARWADASGNVGPWSAALKTRLEGYSANVPMLPGKRMVIQRLERARVALIDMRERSDHYLENSSDREQQMLPPPDAEAA